MSVITPTDIHDRTVHAIGPDGFLVVRYDHAGHWRVETDDRSIGRGVTVDEAVQAAVEMVEAGGVVRLGRRGGTRFGARYQRATAA